MRLWHLFLLTCVCIAICCVIKWAFLIAVACGIALVVKLVSLWYRFRDRLHRKSANGIKDNSNSFP